jgi:hypothetical protein
MLFSKIAVMLAVLLSALAVACGSDSKPDAAPTDVPDTIGSIVVRTGENFTVDSFANNGFKKSKEFSTETVPESTAIWYGFYSQRDIEIRFYPTHELAISAGVKSASEAVGRSPNSNIGGGIITSAGNRTQYNDYLVAGNAVILCQTDITPCKELVDNIPPGG